MISQPKAWLHFERSRAISHWGARRVPTTFVPCAAGLMKSLPMRCHSTKSKRKKKKKKYPHESRPTFFPIKPNFMKNTGELSPIASFIPRTDVCGGPILISGTWCRTGSLRGALQLIHSIHALSAGSSEGNSNAHFPKQWQAASNPKSKTSLRLDCSRTQVT